MVIKQKFQEAEEHHFYDSGMMTKLGEEGKVKRVVLPRE